LELILTRRRFDAAEALRLGLVNRVVEDGTALDQAVVLAASIVAAAPPGAIAAVKRGIGRGPDWTSIDALLGTMRKEEWTEGFSAFLSKRKPDYEPFWEAT